MWSYQRLGIEPDIVTLGKPMGNGHPVAAVITRREIAKRFSPDAEFFSTFGGNPVAMAAALAVLEVIDDERIIEHAGEVGEDLTGRLREIAARTPLIGEVRGIGLAIGVEIVRPGTTEPDAATTKEIVEGHARRSGVLIGTTGRHSNTLKIRPPLVFQREHADQLVETLERRKKSRFCIARRKGVCNGSRAPESFGCRTTRRRMGSRTCPRHRRRSRA